MARYYVLIVLFCLAVGAGMYGITRFVLPTPPTDTVILPTKTISINGASIIVELATTDAQRMQGLSGRASLADGRGMLFVFPQPSTDGFWMKDMNFALDIIWADRAGIITTIASNVSPDTYKTVPPQHFSPTMPSSYVLEVPAGFAAAHGIAVGSKIVVQ